MKIKLDMSSSIPIYVQLRNQIVMGIAKGELQVGDYLPTVRQMAQDSGINVMTVNKAYSILKSEGFIEIDRRFGAKICPRKDSSFEFREKLEEELSLIIAESELKGIDKNDFFEMCKSIYDRINIVSVKGCEV
ncbi:DNA-binding transcriptional regulator YhcF, GntR family [Caloramator quimbayensis]|uniref:DNA-binding transcriptional regulator YhcF, GntR family n=1 Tax=Caloramator quimbayensis TaxID=1147123 RepID=A0A1T4WLX9_9CLOT|nr:GntR family transcriptional regulator [Caloramator quimbayensis]SKA78343.1 DNA-binding transcriptional regulator YhcF, GntR family [Caloramator quimbayensis]